MARFGLSDKPFLIRLGVGVGVVFAGCYGPRSQYFDSTDSFDERLVFYSSISAVIQRIIHTPRFSFTFPKQSTYIAMEALLSLSFDNISSYDQAKIRKGLRQVEGLLAQICLSPSPKTALDRRRSTIDPGKEPPPRKALDELGNDPAFREFFKLQDGFEWNVAMRLVNCLDRLLGKTNDGQNDLLIIQTLDLIQGILLLHPPSRSLFSRELYMNHLLDLLEPVNCPAIQSATIITLVCALIDAPQNTRTFEALDGLLTITSLFRSRETARDVKLKLVEFLYFYLMPETPSIPSANATEAVPALIQRSPSKLAGAFNRIDPGAGRKRADSESETTRTTEEKQALLGRHLHSVDDLVADLRESAPFGGAVC